VTEPVVRLNAVDAGYRAAGGERRVLERVDLELRRAEMVAVLGANGSGKTTLLGVMAGTIRPTAGSVELSGRPIGTWSRAEIARSVAVLPQSLELPAGFRVSEVVAMGRTPHAGRWFGWEPDDRRAVADALRDADAESLADRPVTELSGGERQRVLVALALAQEPNLLLMDEPTTHQDVAHAAWLLSSVSRLAHVRGVTVVVVLHDLVLAGMWAPRVIVLDCGHIAADGPPDTALRPEVVRRAYGVAVETAVTEQGRRILVPHFPTLAGAPSGGSTCPLVDTIGVRSSVDDHRAGRHSDRQNTDRSGNAAVGPGNGVRNMPDKRPADDRLQEQSPAPSDADTDSQEDTEGHFVMPNIAAARALANSHSREIERNVRVRVQHKDGRPGEKRNR